MISSHVRAKRTFKILPLALNVESSTYISREEATIPELNWDHLHKCFQDQVNPRDIGRTGKWHLRLEALSDLDRRQNWEKAKYDWIVCLLIVTKLYATTLGWGIGQPSADIQY